MLVIYTNGMQLMPVLNLVECSTTNQRKTLPTVAYVTLL